MSDKSLRLGDQLIEAGYITEDHLKLALRKQRLDGGLLGQSIVSLDFMTDNEMSGFLSVRANSKTIRIDKDTVDRGSIRLLTREQATSMMSIPISERDGHIQVACADMTDLDIIDRLHSVLGSNIELFSISPNKLKAFIEFFYTIEDDIYQTIDELLSMGASGIEGDDSDVIVKFVDQVLFYSMKSKATDIHIEPQKNIYRIRMRVDGQLRTITLLPFHCGAPIIARIKILSDLNPSDKREPQDGRMSIKSEYSNYEIRVSILPTGSYHGGESVVLRLLDQDMMSRKILSLGMPSYAEDIVLQGISKPNGLILVTGPTGSGKTTTLYSCLNEINKVDTAIFTVENPIEAVRHGIQQIAANMSGGITFSEALREILRQDPDVIMVGEMRDPDTAEVGVRAAMTGHLVLSSLHTNSAYEAVYRLADMGIEPYIIAAVLKTVIAQRLVRKVCVHCATRLTDGEVKHIHVRMDVNFDNPSYVKASANGCDACSGSGYAGRFGIFEVLDITPALASMISQDASPGELMSAIELSGFKTMFEDGMERASRGLTTIEEVLRVTGYHA